MTRLAMLCSAAALLASCNGGNSGAGAWNGGPSGDESSDPVIQDIGGTLGARQGTIVYDTSMPSQYGSTTFVVSAGYVSMTAVGIGPTDFPYPGQQTVTGQDGNTYYCQYFLETNIVKIFKIGIDPSVSEWFLGPVTVGN